MTQEDKELLLEDLSARVPFKVKLYIESLVNPIIHDKGIRTLATVLPTRGAIEYDIQGSNQGIIVELVKPILRPLSSMTDEERKELKILFDAEEVTNDSIGFLEGGTLEDYVSQIGFSFCGEITSWLISHHFDYRNLIDKGLAVSELDFRAYGRRG